MDVGCGSQRPILYPDGSAIIMDYILRRPVIILPIANLQGTSFSLESFCPHTSRFTDVFCGQAGIRKKMDRLYLTCRLGIILTIWGVYNADYCGLTTGDQLVTPS